MTRPSGPVPGTDTRSIFRTLARARTAGAAKTLPRDLGSARGADSVFALCGGASSAWLCVSDVSVSNTASSAPTAIFSPSPPLRVSRVPATGAPISTVALSVIRSTSACPSLKVSPSAACHLTTSTSAMPSPMSGSLKTWRPIASVLQHAPQRLAHTQGSGKIVPLELARIGRVPSGHAAMGASR